jgi:hypothetical protein
VSEWLESYQYLSLNALVLPSELHPLVGRPGQAVTRGECSNRLETTAIGAAWRADAPRYTNHQGRTKSVTAMFGGR